MVLLAFDLSMLHAYNSVIAPGLYYQTWHSYVRLMLEGSQLPNSKISEILKLGSTTKSVFSEVSKGYDVLITLFKKDTADRKAKPDCREARL